MVTRQAAACVFVCGLLCLLVVKAADAAGAAPAGWTLLGSVADDIAQAADRAGSGLARDAGELVEWWRQRSGGWITHVGLFSMVAGLVSCFLGYRVFRLVLCVVGLVVGGVAGWVGCEAAFPGARLAVLAGAIVAALAGLGIAFLAYYVGVFLFGAAAATALALIVKVHYAPHSNQLILLAPAAVGGVLALLLRRPLLIIATALGGAWHLTVGAFALLGRGTDLANPQLARVALENAETFREMLHREWPMLPVWGVLTLLGAAVQFRTTRGQHTSPQRAAA